MLTKTVKGYARVDRFKTGKCIPKERISGFYFSFKFSRRVKIRLVEFFFYLMFPLETSLYVKIQLQPSLSRRM